MKSTYFSRAISLLLIVVLMMFVSSFATFAVSKTEFSLSDAQSKKGRVFQVELSCKGASVSAFVAELTFDAEKLSYRSVAFSDEEIEYSVNSCEAGRITIVFLSKYGVDCSEEATLMTFKFKALSEENTQILLSVKDAVDCNAQDVAVAECNGCRISPLYTGSANSQSLQEINAEGLINAEENSESLLLGSTAVGGVPVSNQTLFSFLFALICTMFFAVYIAYRLGQKKQNNKIKKSAPLIFKEKADENR